MTLSEMRTRVLNLLSESTSSPESYTTAEIDRLLNDSYREVARDTGALEIELDIEARTGVGAYDLPDNIGKIRRVEWDAQRILPASSHELDRHDMTWNTRTGTPMAYKVDDLNDQIRIYPIPASEDRVIFEDEYGIVTDFEGADTYTYEDNMLADYQMTSAAEADDPLMDLTEHHTGTQNFVNGVLEVPFLSGYSALMYNADQRFNCHGESILTITARIRSNGGITGAICGKSNGTIGWFLEVSSNLARMNLTSLHVDPTQGAPSATATGTTDLSDGAWHIVVGQINHASGVMTVTVDGTQEASVSITLHGDASSTNYFGVGTIWSTTPGIALGSAFVGDMDYLTIEDGLEVGVTTDVDEVGDGNLYVFLEQDGTTFDNWTQDDELGVSIDVDPNATLTQELGAIAEFTGDYQYLFDGEFGIVVRAEEGEYGLVTDLDIPSLGLTVWATKDPADLVEATDEPELPEWTHMGLCFEAAARALRKQSEVHNPALAGMYGKMATDYFIHLKKMVMRKTAERERRMSPRDEGRPRLRRPRLPAEYPDVWGQY